MAAQKTAQDVMTGEDGIVESMQRFANDAKCVEYLSGFKAGAEAKMATYQKGMVVKMQHDLSERALKQLQSVSNFEAGMGSAIQELVVSEAASSFREEYPKSEAMQKQALAAAVKSLGGDVLKAGEDPVAAHFESALGSLGGVDLMTLEGNPAGTLAERVAYAQQTKEREFQTTFMVTAAEAAEVKSIGDLAKDGDGFDFSKLEADSLSRLNALYTSINAKVGYSLPDSVGSKAINHSSDSEANAYIESINSELAVTMKQVETARLTAFVKALA